MDISPRRRMAVLAVACLAVTLVSAAIASVNVAIPDIGRDLHASQTDLQWVVDAYTLLLAALLLPAGAVGDRYGRKGSLIVGLLLFGGSSAVAALATDATVLIAARAGMGIGAALLFPVSLSLLTTTFPAEARSRATAVWAASAASGATIGLVAAGLLLRSYAWPSMFWFYVVASGVCLVAGLIALPAGSRDPAQTLDPVGAPLFAVSVGCVVYGIIEGPVRGWTDVVTVGAVLLGLVAGGVFVVAELRTASPMLDPRIFRERALAAGTTVILVQYFSAFGFFFVAIQYLQEISGYGALLAGLAGLPVGVLIVIGSAVVIVAGPRMPLRISGSVGLAVIAAGLLAGAAFGRHVSYWSWPVLAMSLVGAGLGLSTAPATSAITEALPLERQGVASAVNDTARELGAALGIAVMGSVLTSGYRSSFVHSAAYASLPRPLANVSRDGLPGALQVAATAHRTDVLDAAQSALAHGSAVAMLAGAAILVAGAVAVALVAPQPDRVTARSAVVSSGTG